MLLVSLLDLDLSSVPTGTEGYDDLREDAAGRPKDHLTLPTLRAMLERQQRG